MDELITRKLRDNANRTPDAVALSDSRCRITYRELELFSTRIALRLAKAGCRPGDRVVMLANRAAITVATILGVFKAGCVHVPLDPHMPGDRLQYILGDIAPALIVTEAQLCDQHVDDLPPDTSLLLLDELEDLLLTIGFESDRERAELEAASLPEPSQDDVAYCIYTSGSTGRPKGVLITHRSIVAFFDGTRHVYDVDADSRCVSFSPLHFDVYLMDMLFPLARGAHLHLHDDIVVPDLLFGTLAGHDVTHFSAWGMMLGLIAQAADFDGTPLPHLKTILTGADVPDIKTVQRWLKKNPGVRAINAYGPTEVTCASTAYLIHEIEPDRQQLYPIGKPLEHVRIALVDGQGEPIEAADTPGELMIGGPQVMKGYWNLAEETATRLIRRGDAVFYATGDICAYLPDGNLFYVGRKDNEVKIGGYRIHLNEVQRVINSVPKVHASEIVVLESKYGEKLLAAGVLFDGGQDLQIDRQLEAIRLRLVNEMPSYMVPRYVTALDQFPRLSSGKTDRKALLSILQQHVNQFNQE